MRTRLFALVSVLFTTVALCVPASAAPSHTQITGSGSSWAANAVNQWIADVNKRGLPVVFTSTGSAQGRRDFAFRTTDFAVSDLPYQGTDPVTGDTDTSQDRPFTYLPIAAGGVSFPYNLRIAGARVRDLRLTGRTLAGIFTGAITNWNDPLIARDNNGRQLPSLRIVPVVHSEGSAVSFQVGDYFAKQYPTDWARLGGGAPSPYWRRTPGSQAQSGSDGVMNFVTSSAGNGSIAMDEYSYALGANFPVAKVGNQSGYFVAPNAGNVGIALLNARVSSDGVADLGGVYTAPDHRAYPLSYYTYGIIPTGRSGEENKTASTAQRQTLAEFLYYGSCQGQNEMAPIGYAPLPINLAGQALDAIATLKTADPAVDLTGRDLAHCANPTITPGTNPTDRLSSTVAQPPACDRTGQGPCLVGTTPPTGQATALAVAGGATILSGASHTITAALHTSRAPLAHAEVTFYSSISNGAWRGVHTGVTDSHGAVAMRIRPTYSARYEARYAGDTSYAPARSATVTVAARFVVTAHTAKTLRRNHTMTVTGTVTPGRTDTTVILQRLIKRGWVSVDAALLHPARQGSRTVYRYTAQYRPSTTGAFQMRVMERATAANANGYSNIVRGRITK